jgi:biopolymer transport protein TolR
MAVTAGSGGGLHAEMNVTPMIDVLLVLIIIFLMITPLAPKGEEALIPQPAPKNVKTPPPDAMIVLQVLPPTRDGEPPIVKINQQEVSWQKLEPTLRDIFKKRAEKVAFVKGDRELNFEDIAQVIGVAHDAGVVRIGLMSEKKA